MKHSMKIENWKLKILPRKSLGQNFLINPHIVDKIINAGDISKSDLVLEIGPGTGNLTKELAKKARGVVAIEKDARLTEYLREQTIMNNAQWEKVEIIEEDILKFNPANCPLLTDGYKIIANIPYNITSNLLRIIFEKWPRPELIVLLIQKEVAKRIMAKPPHMNLLALSVQYYSDPEIVGYISKNNFRPVPKVDSAIIRLTPKFIIHDTKYIIQLFNLIHIGFSEKRKQLASLLAKKIKIDKDRVGEMLQEIGLSPTARAENLSLEEWKALARTLFS